MKIQADVGEVIAIVFKAAPFSPMATPQGLMMNMTLTKGVFDGEAPEYGPEAFKMSMPDSSTGNDLHWVFDGADILGYTRFGRITVARPKLVP